MEEFAPHFPALPVRSQGCYGLFLNTTPKPAGDKATGDELTGDQGRGSRPLLRPQQCRLHV
ncbi:hypothetical protein BR93DRAFT_925320 [Coniochaeta sp. PMI_546]|nr:hypothetical protein BR93DRAFT_925320 [Coniochaeta sp. PMI_546]